MSSVYGQADVAAVLCALLSLHAIGEWQRRPSSWGWLVTAAACWFAGVLFKESVVLLPVVVLVWLHTGGGTSRRDLCAATGVFLVAGASWMIVRALVLGGGLAPSGAGSVAYDYPWWARVNASAMSFSASGVAQRLCCPS